MVDTLYSVSEKECSTGLTISADNFFVDETASFCEAGLIEHLAQSCSILAGWNAKQQGKEVGVGYIGEIKKCEFVFFPKVGDSLHTHIRFISEAAGVTLASAEAFVGEKMSVSCKLKISL
ncbi:MAG: hydroxymyristoyl-ACP dehydratase [Bacteroidales bacterium]|nr:hydroxymyristoyl-ACP dehydratase [Bacteroidales bacterium]